MPEQPGGDVWGLKETDKQSQYFGNIYRFDFTYINSPEIKKIVKAYVWSCHKAQNKTLSKLYNDVSRFKIFNAFAENRDILRISGLTNVDASEFMSYLKTTISEHSKAPLSLPYQASVFSAFKSIVYWCQIHYPELAPEKEIFTGNEYGNRRMKMVVEFIPDEVLAQINEALAAESNPYVKYGIIILESTGMRIGDLTYLTTDCVQPHPINGYAISWFEHKTRKYRKPLPIRPECVEAVTRLAEATEGPRAQAVDSLKDYLFIHQIIYENVYAKVGDIYRVSPSLMRKWLRHFIKRNSITDTAGNPYALTCHQFRRTLATDMLSKGVNINVIQEVLGHSSPLTTKRHYADVKDKERAEVFARIGIIGNISDVDEQTIVDPDELAWFKSNKNKCVAGLCDGYCTKPFQEDEICKRLLKRQKCYTCSRYITTPEYLDAHRNHLWSLEHQLENNIYGEHYAEHFRPTIEVLKVIIERLEALQNVEDKSDLTNNSRG